MPNKAAIAAAHSLGIDFGFCHVELILSEDGPKIDQIVGIDKAKELPKVKDIHINNNKEITLICDSYSRPEYVIIQGENSTETNETINKVNELLK